MSDEFRIQRQWVFSLDRGNFLQILCPMDLSEHEFEGVSAFMDFCVRQLSRGVTKDAAQEDVSSGVDSSPDKERGK